MAVGDIIDYTSIPDEPFELVTPLFRSADVIIGQGEHTLYFAGNPNLSGSELFFFNMLSPQNPEKLTAEQAKLLDTLRNENLKTAKVYQMKLTFQDICRCVREPKAAEEAFNKWLSWAVRSRPDPVKRFAKLIKGYLQGNILYFTS